MTSSQLLETLGALPFSARQKQIAQWGRDPKNAPLWDELERGTSDQKRIAIQSCATSHDGARAARLCGDSSRGVRTLARHMLAICGSETQIREVWPDFKEKQKRRLLKKLARSRPDVADAILQSLAEDELEESLLAFASPTLAARLLENRWERASADDWGRLARSQPELALQKSLQLARGLTAPDGVALNKINAVLGEASGAWNQTLRALALQVVRESNRVAPLRDIELRALLNFGAAQKLAELVLESGERVELDFSGRAAKLQTQTLLALAHSQQAKWHNWRAVLKRLPPSARGEVYREFHLGWRGQSGMVEAEIVALLPRVIRHDEARRHLELPDVAANPALFLSYVAFLPGDEAKKAAAPFLGDPDPDFRAAALGARVANARFERENLGDVLALLVSRGNEQDPVRMAMLGALGALPPSIWREEHLPPLQKIQRQALDARDLSFGTAAHLERLVVALLPHFPAWTGTQLSELLKERGHVSFYDLQNRLSDAQMREIGRICCRFSRRGSRANTRRFWAPSARWANASKSGTRARSF